MFIETIQSPPHAVRRSGNELARTRTTPPAPPNGAGGVGFGELKTYNP